jgi:hypothetical protein
VAFPFKKCPVCLLSSFFNKIFYSNRNHNNLLVFVTVITKHYKNCDIRHSVFLQHCAASLCGCVAQCFKIALWLNLQGQFVKRFFYTELPTLESVWQRTAKDAEQDPQKDEFFERLASKTSLPDSDIAHFCLSKHNCTHLLYTACDFLARTPADSHWTRALRKKALIFYRNFNRLLTRTCVLNNT